MVENLEKVKMDYFQTGGNRSNAGRSDPKARINPPAIATLLFTHTTPTSIKAIEVLTELTESAPVGAEEILRLAPRIEVALQEANSISTLSAKIVSRCLLLKSIPHPKIPLGF